MENIRFCHYNAFSDHVETFLLSFSNFFFLSLSTKKKVFLHKLILGNFFCGLGLTYNYFLCTYNLTACIKCKGQMILCTRIEWPSMYMCSEREGGTTRQEKVLVSNDTSWSIVSHFKITRYGVKLGL